MNFGFVCFGLKTASTSDYANVMVIKFKLTEN